MEGYSKKEVAEHMNTYLNDKRKYKIKHVYMSGCDGAERVIITEI